MKKALFVILKLSLAVFALWYVFQQIDVARFFDYIRTMSSGYVIAAFLALTVGQITSALRMRYYMATEGIKLTRYYSIVLYWVGALLNLLLPGGIGGDGYKILHLTRKQNLPALLVFRRVVSGRANGLLILIILAIGLGYFSHIPTLVSYGYILLTVALFMVIPCYFMSVKLLLKESTEQAVGALRYSFIVQCLCVATAYCLFVAMGVDAGLSVTMRDYLVVFLVSSIVAVLPISIGGVGIRELTFYYGALLFGLDTELGVAFSLVYFAINSIISLAGVYFWLHLSNIHAIEKD